MVTLREGLGMFQKGMEDVGTGLKTRGIMKGRTATIRELGAQEGESFKGGKVGRAGAMAAAMEGESVAPYLREPERMTESQYRVWMMDEASKGNLDPMNILLSFEEKKARIMGKARNGGGESPFISYKTTTVSGFDVDTKPLNLKPKENASEKINELVSEAFSLESKNETLRLKYGEDSPQYKSHLEKINATTAPLDEMALNTAKRKIKDWKFLTPAQQTEYKDEMKLKIITVFKDGFKDDDDKWLSFTMDAPYATPKTGPRRGVYENSPQLQQQIEEARRQGLSDEDIAEYLKQKE